MSTIKYTLPISGKDVELKEYLTGRDQLEINKAVWGGMKMEAVEDARPEIDGASMLEATQITYSKFVVSVGGVTENAYELLLDLPAADYEFISQKINEINEKAKKGQAASTTSTKDSSDSEGQE